MVWVGRGGARTSQMKVKRSCHGAFLGSRARAAVVARTAMLATPAKEKADVAVNTEGDGNGVSSIFGVFFWRERESGRTSSGGSE